MLPKCNAERFSEIVAFKITPRQLVELDLVARVQETSRSEVIRRGLRREADAAARGQGFSAGGAS